jgi:hypothetical protein
MSGGYNSSWPAPSIDRRGGAWTLADLLRSHGLSGPASYQRLRRKNNHNTAAMMITHRIG